MKPGMHIIILCLAAVPLAGLEAWAENTGPCAEDITKLCMGVQSGGGRIMDCLRKNEQELSTACKDHQLVMIKKFKDAPQVCQDDVEQFCRQVRPENRRILRCLKANEAQLSTECGKIMKDVN